MEFLSARWEPLKVGPSWKSSSGFAELSRAFVRAESQQTNFNYRHVSEFRNRFADNNSQVLELHSRWRTSDVTKSPRADNARQVSQPDRTQSWNLSRRNSFFRFISAGFALFLFVWLVQDHYAHSRTEGLAHTLPIRVSRRRLRNSLESSIFGEMWMTIYSGRCFVFPAHHAARVYIKMFIG